MSEQTSAPPMPAPLAQLRIRSEGLWQLVYRADEQQLKQALSAALLGDTELAERIVTSHSGSWRLLQFPDLNAHLRVD